MSEPLDTTDQDLLDRLAALYAQLDPPPAELDDRVRFTIALENVDVEIARLSQEELVGSGARGTERTRTITFDCDSRTIMVTITDTPAGLVRIDGWLAPAAQLRIELRRTDGSETTDSDDDGRFVFDHAEHGLAQLLVHRDDAGAGPVITPSLML